MKRLKPIEFIFVVVLLLCLVAIRFFEDELFYDPYLQFFRDDFLQIDSPRREVAKLTLFTTIRYWLNSGISLVILFLLFKKKSVVKLSGLLYAISFAILVSIYLYFVINPRKEDYYLFFYFRRFLIQPVLLIILVPAFYYHFVKNKNNKIFN